MTNQYRATSPYGEAIYGKDVFDADFTAGEERDHLDGGHLEIVPRDYTVMSDNFSGGAKGAVYQGAFPREIEEALMSGGHLTRVGEDKSASTETVADDDESVDELDDEEL